MPKRRIGLHKDVSSIFKCRKASPSGDVPLSADDPVVVLRRMPILQPPKYAPAPAQPPLVSSIEPARPAGGDAGQGSAPTSASVVAPAAVLRQEDTGAKPCPDVGFSDKPARGTGFQPAVHGQDGRATQPQSGTKPATGVSVPKTLAPKKTKIAVTMKARQPATGGMQKSLQQLKEKLFAAKPGVSRNRQKAMVVLVPALAIVLVFVLTQVVSSPSYTVAKDKQQAPPAAAGASGGEIDWQIPTPYPATLHDPMQARTRVPAQVQPQVPEAEQPQGEKLIVRSILHSENKPSAVVGTQIVHEGDTVLGTTVVRIHRDGVEFEKDGKKWTQKVEN